MKKLLILLMLVSMSLVWTGSAVAEDITIAYIANGPYTFWTYAHAGCITAEEQFGVKVEFYKPPQAMLEEQKRFIES